MKLVGMTKSLVQATRTAGGFDLSTHCEHSKPFGAMYNGRARSASTRFVGRGRPNGAFVCDWIGATAKHKQLVRCVLDSGPRPMEAAGCLRENSGKHKAI